MSLRDYPKTVRLRDSKAYGFVFNGATKTRSGHLVCLYRANTLGFSRLGIMISKKQLKRAVWRNRVKRLIRESFRQHRERMPAIDMIILGYKGLEAQENEVIVRHAESLWKQLSTGLKK